jgi:drug/metabolite transporter (DMT)-like permease
VVAQLACLGATGCCAVAFVLLRRVMAALVPLAVLGTGLAYLCNARNVRGLGATT